MENIDDFNRGVGLILGHLYQQFPIPCILHARELETFDASLDEARKGRRLRVYTASIHFLAEEGFIRFSSFNGDKNSGSFSNVVLTSKGLAALSKTPQSIEKSRNTIGDVLVDLSSDLLKQGTWEGISALIRGVLGG
ncbi:MAG: hypothetical protein HQL51_16280 [Magnetococcales bacterium]|nr:hypothetical protein [Magnetococcales bacterium]